MNNFYGYENEEQMKECIPFKFRVWDIEFKEMLYGSENMVSASGRLYCNYNIAKLKAFPSDTYKIMQWTGLKDKNDKEIYEGDIIETSDFIGVVVFSNGHYCIEEKVAKVPMFCNDDINTFSHRKFGVLYWDTVIGNIFENPELLK